MDIDNKKEELKKKITNIFKIFEKNLNNEKNQILIQNMITNVKMSGVIFTHDADNNSPYYCINYDDISGKSDTVTSGRGIYSNKSLYLLRGKENKLKSKRFINLICAVKELEDSVDNNKIDIEFALTKKNTLYLLQVRPLAKKKFIYNQKFFNKISNIVLNVEKKLKPKFRKNKYICGKTTVFGQMPDWNPVEMIGLHPSKLAFSLYKYLITKSSWLVSRKMMGYKDIKDPDLMLNIIGKPYIDVRKSFNSFLPNKCNKILSNKVIDAAIEKLKLEPNLHDKVEFDVIPNCYCLDFEKKFNKYSNTIKKDELMYLKKEYKNIFIKNLFSGKGSIDYNLLQIKNLKKKQEADNIYNENLSVFNIKQILDDCKNFGVIPFGILARHAFVAKEILNSLVRLKILNETDVSIFNTNIETITNSFLIDLKKLKKRKISKKIFLNKYGHLRPGTYDINSKSYKEMSLNGIKITDNLAKKGSVYFLKKKTKKT